MLGGLGALNKVGVAVAQSLAPSSASLNLDFTLGSLDSRITFTRASTATFFNSAGVLTSAAVDVARFDYNPSTLAPRGLLIEEARTNSIRNNTMVGAVAGTPGTLPTNWGVNAFSGITVSVSGVSTENGITYVDLNYSGTAGVTGNQFVAFDTVGGIAASDAQTWTHSIYIKQVTSVTLPAVSVAWRIYNSSSGLIAANGATVTVADNSANLRTTRQTYSAALSGATIASIRPTVEVALVSGTAYNFTLRIGLPQLELGAFATSVIPTTTTALTRSADVATMTGTNFSSWYNQSAGTFLTVYSLARPPTGLNQFTVRSSDNTYNNAIAMNTNSTGFPQISTASGGVFDGLASASPALTANVTAKVAGCYAANDLAISLNGAAVVTDTSATIPTALTRLDIGSDHAGVNRIQGGHIQRIAYYPTRLANAQLQALTS